MITMSPVLLHGRYVWDQSYFPRDECEERLHIVQGEMARRGLQGLIVAGSYTHYDDFCYLTQYIPISTWSLAVAPSEGDMTMITGVGGGRELPAARARTWVPDVRNLKSWNPGLKELLHERDITGTVGLVSFDEALNAGRSEAIVAGLDGFELVAADDLMAGIRRSLRAREISAIQQAAGFAHAAADALAKAHAGGASNGAALVEAEGEARRAGALDFRGLANLDGTNQLMPLEELTSFRTDSMVAYLAANSLGYWADLGVTLGPAPHFKEAERALEAMAGGIRTGAKASDVARLAMLQLSDEHLREAELYGLGNGIGLSLGTAPKIAASSQDTLVEDTVITLRARLGGSTGPGALTSALVLVKTGCCKRL